MPHETDSSWTRSPAAAHVAPLLLFMLTTSLAGVLTSETASEWYRRAPQHWLYPLQCALVGAVLLFFRRRYTFGPWRGLALSALLAVVGIALWVLPAQVARDGQPSWMAWLGVVPRRTGFDPNIFTPDSAAWWTTVILRFVRLVVIVPLVEEIFWRGFLMRYVQAGEADFSMVPFGQHAWRAFWIVTLAVTLAHNPPDYLAAFVWGSLMYALAVRTKSLGACVLMHAIGNAALGVWILRTGQWGFW